MDCRDPNYGEDQNIGLHGLVSQASMHRMDTTQKVTIDRWTAMIPLDAGYCPFCAYHARCHRTLNNHVRIHLRLSMFCGVGDCFFATSDTKIMIPHAIAEHLDVYVKSKKLTPK